MEVFNIGRFWRWWRAELAAMLPPSDPRRAASHGADVELHIGTDRVAIYRKFSLLAPLVAPAGTWRTIDETHGSLRPKERIVLSLDESHCLMRYRRIPTAAAAEAERILALDIARTTPFSASDVVSGWYAEGVRQPDGSRTISHVVVRRDLLSAAMNKLGAQGIRCDAVTVRPANRAALPIVFNANGQRFGQKTESRWRKVTASAASIALVFAAAAIAIVLNRQHRELADLRQAVAELQNAAVEVRKEVEARLSKQRQVAGLAELRRGNVSTVAVWEELSRLIPDGAWLQSLGIERDGLLIEGRAAAAEELIPAIESSAMFANARFASPVYKASNDANQNFSIKFGLEREVP